MQSQDINTLRYITNKQETNIQLNFDYMASKDKKVKNTKSQFEEKTDAKKPFHVKQLKCKNEKQKELVESIKNNEITICTGEAGTGKTYIALNVALKLLERGYKKIVLVKSVQTIPEEELGFLPGDQKEKMEPFMYSYTGNLVKMIDEKDMETLFNNGTIQILPLAYIRGVNIDDSVVILDECQNISLNTFKSIITRIGSNSKYIILGDTQQIDMKRKKDSSLEKVVSLFRDEDYVGVVEFQEADCVRNPIIPKLLNKLNNIENTQEIQQPKKNESHKYIII